MITAITGTNRGYVRVLKSILGDLHLSQKQEQILGVAVGKRISPYLELCCLRVSANVSYANAESDIAMLTGMVVSDTTQQRLVQTTDFPDPVATQALTEACVDGGKVRLRTPVGDISIWRDDKAVATDQGLMAALHDNPRLIHWVKGQPLSRPLTCLGDGHDGVGNIIGAFATPAQRREVLDWFHLNENLHKVGGSLKRLRQAEALRWKGQVDETLALFADMTRKPARNFCVYLETHRPRIINYDYYQAEGICSIDSGAVESAIKQIDRRLHISGGTVEDRKCPASPGTPGRLSQSIILPKRMKCSHR